MKKNRLTSFLATLVVHSITRTCWNHLNKHGCDIKCRYVQPELIQTCATNIPINIAFKDECVYVLMV